jgi:hypothetical protein
MDSEDLIRMLMHITFILFLIISIVLTITITPLLLLGIYKIFRWIM